MSALGACLGVEGKVSRGQYATYGVLLFGLKFLIDRIVVSVWTGQYWEPWFYLFWPSWLERVQTVSASYQGLLYALLFLALPFIFIGVNLTVKRLRDAGLPVPLVVIFFLPFINILFFVILSVIPSANDGSAGLSEGRTFLQRIVPETQWGSAAFGMVSAAFLGGVLAVISVKVLGSYGWAVFVGTPFTMGLFSAMFYAVSEQRSSKECVTVANASVFLLGGLMLLFAFEGVVCIAMAAPLALILASFGGYVAYFIQRNRRYQSQVVDLAVMLPALLPLLVVLDVEGSYSPPSFSVTSEIDIQATPEVVWKNVVTFRELPPPKELIFRSGVAYPLRASISGHGVGAVRRCEFSTGVFVEPIRIWDEPRVLAFDVTEVPAPLQEWTPFATFEQPHLHGYFRSSQGEFRLTTISPQITRLSGTTWYENRMWPGWYWGLFSDYIVHQIHLRVLRHIRDLSESA